MREGKGTVKMGCTDPNTASYAAVAVRKGP